VGRFWLKAVRCVSSTTPFRTLHPHAENARSSTGFGAVEISPSFDPGQSDPAIDFVSVYCAKPSIPFCRPIPLDL
jgi:hypothetical protein